MSGLKLPNEEKSEKYYDRNLFKMIYATRPNKATPLEIRRAVEGNSVNKVKAREELINMFMFLLNINNEVKSSEGSTFT